MSNNINIGFISGFVFGLEVFLGEDLIEGDTFAMTLSLGILRITYIRSRM